MNIFDPHITGSLSVSSSAQISGDLTVLGTIYGAAEITGEVTNAISASYAPSYVLTSSFNNYTSSLATTGSNSFVGNQTIEGSILPDRTLTHDLGSDAQRWGDIYLAGNTIDIGGTKISKNDDGDVQFKDGSNNLKKIIASEIEIGSGNSKKILKVSNGKLKLTDIIGTDDSLAALSGSFTGSFVGDGSNLTNVPATSVTGGFENDLIITGSIRLTGTVDGVDVSGLKSDVDAILLGSSADKNSFAEIVQLINSVDTTNDQAFASHYTSSNSRFNSIESTTSSFDGRLDSIEVITASLDGRVDTLESTSTTTTNRLGSLETNSGSVDTSISNITTKLSGIDVTTGSLIGRIGVVEETITRLDETYATDSDITTLRGNLNTYTSSNNTTNTNQNNRLGLLETESGSIRLDFNTYTSSNKLVNNTQDSKLGSLESTSGSHGDRLDSIELFTSSIDDTYATDEDVTRLRGDLNTYTSSNNTTNTTQNGRLTSLEIKTGSLNTEITNIGGRLGSLETKSGSVDDKLRSIETTTSSFDGRLDSLETTSGSHNDRIDTLETFKTDLGVGLELTGSNVTIKGNLLVKGTETRVNSTTVDLSDNVISLNGSAATLGGIEVRDNSSPSFLSGSLLWDGERNYWIGGRKGLEERILLDSDLSTLDLRLDSLETESGSIRTNFNTYTSSNNTTNTNQNNRLTSLETKTGSLDGVNTTQNGRLTSLETKTGSLDGNISLLDGRIDSIESFTASIDLTYATDEDVTRLRGDFNSHTTSISNRINGEKLRIDSLELFSSSIDNTYATDNDVTSLRGTLNTYTSSNNTTNNTQNGRLTSLESATSSLDGRLDSIEITTGSLDGRLDSIESVTGSYLTEHPTIGAASSSNNSGRTYIQDILLDSYGHITGISTSTETVVNTNHYTTGVTWNGTTATLRFDRNDGGSYNVQMLETLSDVTVTGGTYDSGTQTLRLTKSDGNSVSVSGFAIDTDVNWYTTGATFNTSTGVVTGTLSNGSLWSVDIDGRYSLSDHVHTFASLTSKPTTLSGFGITDAATSAQGTKADTAFGWGNHATRGYLTSYVDTNNFTTGATFNTSDGVITFTKNDGGIYNVDIDGRYLTAVTGTASGQLNMNNFNIIGVNSIIIGDPGPGEGISWGGGSGWSIWESPNDLTTNTSGNLQFVKNGTRVMTIDTSNNVSVLGLITASGGDSANWNTAFGWGDHSTRGYLTSYTDTNNFTTGSTFNSTSGILTFTRNNGDTYTVNLSATLTDVTVTGGTYNSSNQTLTLTKSNGSTVAVSGFAIDTDVNWYTNSATFNASNGIITGTRTDGGTWYVDSDGRYLTVESDTFHTVTW